MEIRPAWSCFSFPCKHPQRSRELDPEPPAQQHPQPSPTLSIRVPKTATSLRSGEREKKQGCGGRNGVKKSKGSPSFRKVSFPLPPQWIKGSGALCPPVGKERLSQALETAGPAIAGTCGAFSFTDFQSGAIKMSLCSLQLTCKLQPSTSERSGQLKRQSAEKYITKALQMGTGSLENKGKAC